MKKTLGIIGFGRFGRLAAGHLKKHFKVWACDSKNLSEEAKKIGVEFGDLAECASKDVVLICVPISGFEGALKKAVPFLKKGSIVLDVCSVKEMPAALMKSQVPEWCDCIGAHPLFGPDTAADSLNGKKIALCPVRTCKLDDVKRFLEKLGLEVIITTPEEHDRQMAKSMVLVHLIGRALLEMGAQEVDLSTKTHEMFIEAAKVAKNDSEELFVDIQTYNRFAKKARKEIIEKLEKIDSKLG